MLLNGRLSFLLLAAIGLLELTACRTAPAPSREPSKMFNLEIRRPPAAPLLDKPLGVLQIRPFRVESRYDSANLVYRTGENDFAVDEKHQLLAAPRDLITDDVREWLKASGLFKQVVDLSSHLESDWILEGEVRSMYGDFRPYRQPQAEMEIAFLLIHNPLSGPRIAFQRAYRYSAALPNESAESLTQGYEEDLRQILAAFETDLASAILKTRQ